MKRSPPQAGLAQPVESVIRFRPAPQRGGGIASTRNELIAHIPLVELDIACGDSFAPAGAGHHQLEAGLHDAGLVEVLGERACFHIPISLLRAASSASLYCLANILS